MRLQTASAAGFGKIVTAIARGRGVAASAPAPTAFRWLFYHRDGRFDGHPRNVSWRLFVGGRTFPGRGSP
jgi:hypothetical protein